VGLPEAGFIETDRALVARILDAYWTHTGRMILLFLIATSLILLYQPADARAKRSQSAIVGFKQQHPCPATGASKGPCKGYVIDHVKALACGGANAKNRVRATTPIRYNAVHLWRHGAGMSYTVR
jgi:hypothetical protein